MLQAEVNGYICRSTDNYDVLYDTLEVITADSNPSVEAMNKRKLAKVIRSCSNLVCYDKAGNVVGACIYTVGILGIELLHMYVVPRYRVTYGSAILNHYLINIVGDGKEIGLRSSDISTFGRVVEETKRLGVYTISDRARLGLKRMLKDKVKWSEI